MPAHTIRYAFGVSTYYLYATYILRPYNGIRLETFVPPVAPFVENGEDCMVTVTIELMNGYGPTFATGDSESDTTPHCQLQDPEGPSDGYSMLVLELDARKGGYVELGGSGSVRIKVYDGIDGDDSDFDIDTKDLDLDDFDIQ